MRRVLFSMFAIALSFVFLASCGKYSPMNPRNDHNAALVSLSMTDAPPAGVTILSFEVSLTGATLSPGNADLLGGKSPIRIELKNLETEAAFLSTASIPAGNYSTLNLTFANPEITFQNNTGATLAGCAPNAVCQIEPTAVLAATVNGPFNVSANTQSGLLVDVNLATVVSNTLAVDFSSPSAVTAQPQVGENNGELEDLDDVSGTVQAVSGSQFTLATAMGNIIVTTDSNTQFKDFANCAAANFSCLQSGQSVDADLLLMASGSFLAKKVELADDEAENKNENENGDNDLEGVVFKVDSPSQFEIVVLNETGNIASVSAGSPVGVTLSTGGGVSFRVDSDGLNVPSSLQSAFEGATDTSQLLPGQTVQIRDRSMSGGPAPAAIMITTDRVRLRMASFTAAVSGAPSGANFNVGNLPGVFTSAGIQTIQVQTSSQTNFNNVAGVGSLTNGTSVSLRGLLFVGSPNPALIADKVIKR
jgi:Domain of unknown function (DUF5666)/Domain of unknown function (DUF4382)